MQPICVRSVVEEVAGSYPKNFAEYAKSDIERITYDVELALGTQLDIRPENLSFVDLSGNFALFSAVCTKLGFRQVIVMEDFGDPVNLEHGDGLLELHRRLGVNFINKNLVSVSPDDLPAADIHTTVDSMEHWHASPRRVFGAVAQQVSQGAGFVLGVPNCVNLRKRLSIALGRGKWSSMDDWYDKDIFRGHVREPDVQDLAYIADDMNLGTRRIVGRDFQGYYHANALVRTLTHYIDKPLGLFPSLCSDIYLVGRK